MLEDQTWVLDCENVMLKAVSNWAVIKHSCFFQILEFSQSETPHILLSLCLSKIFIFSINTSANSLKSFTVWFYCYVYFLLLLFFVCVCEDGKNTFPWCHINGLFCIHLLLTLFSLKASIMESGGRAQCQSSRPVSSRRVGRIRCSNLDSCSLQDSMNDARFDKQEVPNSFEAWCNGGVDGWHIAELCWATVMVPLSWDLKFTA